MEVPNQVDPEVLKRELAKKGHHVVKSYFEHNTITNERTGKGFIQVRAPNPRYHEDLRNEINDIGLKVKKQVGATMPNQNMLAIKGKQSKF